MEAPVLTRNLWVTAPMMRGDDVLALQRRLVALGYKLDQDGLLGRGTGGAILAFQRRNGLRDDGIVGAATWARLFAEAGREPPPAVAERTAAQLIGAALGSVGAFHGFQDGCRWRLTRTGLVVEGEDAPSVSQAETQRVQSVLGQHGQAIASVLNTVSVPVELILACICTESGGKADAKRFEPGCDTSDPERTPDRVSFGLMQTLLSTAREALGMPGLTLAQLLTPETSVRAGATYIWRQGRQTRFDPPLVAAAYNAGSLRHNANPANRWRLVQFPIGTGKHVDRFVRFFNAAMALPDHGLGEVPSWKTLLAQA